MRRRTLLRTVALLAAAAVVGAPPSLAQEKGEAAEIRIGMSAARSGPNQALGRSVRRGIESCFRHVNAGGGVGGRPLRLIALDDGYEPSVAAANMTQLVEDEHVLAVLGNVGTPTAEVTVPIALAAGVPFIGPVTGASFLRGADTGPYVVNFRAGYAEETKAIIDGLLEAGIRPHEIAFFTQSDGYGQQGYAGALKALEDAGFRHGKDLAHGRYERNTVDVSDGLLTILASETRPRAIVMVGTYAPCARFIRIARRALPFTYFVAVSFVSGVELAEALDGATERVIITQVVPHPDTDVPLCRDYRRDHRAAFPEDRLGFVSLEGYVVARVLVQALQDAGPDVTRESLLEAVRKVDIPDTALGAPVRFDGDDRQGCHTVWPMHWVEDELRPLDWRTLRTRRGEFAEELDGKSDEE